MQLANTKAAWYGFQLALDIPEASSTHRRRRCATPVSPTDAALEHHAGARHVGWTQQTPPAAFDGGAFMGKRVYLGEVVDRRQRRG